MSNLVKCHINRAVMDAGNDLFNFLDRVYAAVVRNFNLFGADGQWDVYPEEIHAKRVVVRNSKTGEYLMADQKDKDGEISLSNSKQVKRQWVTMDETERSEGSEAHVPEVLESGLCAVVERNVNPSFWEPILRLSKCQG